VKITVAEINKVIMEILGVEAILYGSHATGLAIRGMSDLNLFIELTSYPVDK
jgi:hypothetical protein